MLSIFGSKSYVGMKGHCDFALWTFHSMCGLFAHRSKSSVSSWEQQVLRVKVLYSVSWIIVFVQEML